MQIGQELLARYTRVYRTEGCYRNNQFHKIYSYIAIASSVYLRHFTYFGTHLLWRLVHYAPCTANTSSAGPPQLAPHRVRQLQLRETVRFHHIAQSDAGGPNADTWAGNLPAVSASPLWMSSTSSPGASCKVYIFCCGLILKPTAVGDILQHYATRKVCDNVA